MVHAVHGTMLESRWLVTSKELCDRRGVGPKVLGESLGTPGRTPSTNHSQM